MTEQTDLYKQIYRVVYGSPDGAVAEAVFSLVQPLLADRDTQIAALRAELAAARESIPVDDLARLLHDADVFVNGGDYPSWDSLSDTQGLGKDQVRKAARWLLRRLNINPHKPAPKEA